MRVGRADDLAMHPTVKPVALVADAIKDCSRRGGAVERVAFTGRSIAIYGRTPQSTFCDIKPETSGSNIHHLLGSRYVTCTPLVWLKPVGLCLEPRVNERDLRRLRLCVTENHLRKDGARPKNRYPWPPGPFTLPLSANVCANPLLGHFLSRITRDR